MALKYRMKLPRIHLILIRRLISFCICFVFTIGISSCGRKNSLVTQSEAMEPTLTVGQIVYYETRPKSLKRNDLVVFRIPENENSISIMRIIGLPREQIQFTEKGITINSSIIHLPESFIYKQPEGPIYRYAILSPVTIRPNHYFLIGDNFEKVRDSRVFGFVPRENIIGLVVGVEDG